MFFILVDFLHYFDDFFNLEEFPKPFFINTSLRSFDEYNNLTNSFNKSIFKLLKHDIPVSNLVITYKDVTQLLLSDTILRHRIYWNPIKLLVPDENGSYNPLNLSVNGFCYDLLMDELNSSMLNTVGNFGYANDVINNCNKQYFVLYYLYRCYRNSSTQSLKEQYKVLIKQVLLNVRSRYSNIDDVLNIIVLRKLYEVFVDKNVIVQ